MRFIFTLLLLLALQPLKVYSSETLNTKPLTAHVSTKEAFQGGSTNLNIELKLAAPYRAYLDQFKLKVLSPKEMSVASFQVTPVVTFFDTFSKKEKKGLQGDGQMTTTLSIDPLLPLGTHDLVLEITYQACTDDNCLFPTKLEVPAKIRVVSGDRLSSNPNPVPRSSDSGILSFESALEKGLLYTFLFVFFAGILTSFTPCIFPMIPITLSIIGASQIRHLPGSETAIKKRSRLRGFFISVVYVFGIAITYAILGVIAAQTGALFGAALSNPWVVSFIAVVFVIMGLSMYGLFEIQMPSFIRDNLSKAKTDPGFAGAFVAGLIAGIVASPCVGPVLVGLLTHVAKTQNSLLGFSLLFTFAIGMGLLLIAIGTFSSLASKLPKSGGWMDGVKFVFGTAMIGMALFYIEPILPQSAFYILFGLSAIMITSAFGAFMPNEQLTTIISRIHKGLMVLGFLLGLIYFVRGLMFQTPFVLPSVSGANEAASANEKIWQPFTEDAFNEALKNGTPIIIDFWAEWCAACKELEKFTFSDLAVQQKLGKFKAFKLDMTVDTAQNTTYRQKFKIMGLPTIHFYNDGKLREDLTLTGFESADDFHTRLENVLQNR